MGGCYPLRGLVCELVSEVGGEEWNPDLLGFCGADGDDLHGEVVFVWELSIGEEAKHLGPGRVDNKIAGEKAVDTNSVVKVGSGLSSGEVVNIMPGILALDFHDFCTGEALPVKTKLVVEAGKLLAERPNEHGRVWSDVDVLLPPFEETDDGGG